MTNDQLEIHIKLNCKFKTFGSWISGISIRCFKVYIHDSPISVQVLLYLSFKKSVETKHAYEKSTFYCIGMIVFKLEIIKEIFENEKLKLSLNSIR